MIPSRTLVTGGAGCIGSELCAALVARGDSVVAFDNLSSGKVEHVEPLQDRPNFRLVVGDLLDPAALDKVVPGVGIVYHLAANPDVKFTPEAPDRDLRQNTLATHALLEAMRRHRVGRLAFASTSAVYGNSPRQPIPEDQAPRPISLYGATKLACEAMIGAYQHLFGLQCWVFRFANIVGGQSRAKGRTVLSDFVAKLRADPRRLPVLGDGRQAKSYLAADECVSGMLYAVEHALEPFNLFNLGGDDTLSVRRIAEMVVEQMGLRDVEFSFTGTEAGWPGDVPRFRLDVTAINRLGWRARRTSEQAVAEAISALLRGQHNSLSEEFD
jgi:UDP-glucose 4-epimerase